MTASIAEYHESLRLGKTTCRQTVSTFLHRISANRSLNAFTEVYADEAIQQALLLDEARERSGLSGRLHGVVVAIKDVIAFRGKKLTAASQMLQGFSSLYHATAVQRLLDEGAIVIGSCNCDEFAMGSSNEHSVYGPVRNAANPLRVPGGSSGGSAVAVQAGLCMLSLGSDTGGSVRQPAGFCGVIGVKPGYGSVSRHGLLAYASSFDQIGVMGTVMDDIALALQVISGPDAFDSTLRQHPPEPLVEQGPNPVLLKPNPGRPFRFAYIREAVNHHSLDPEIGNAMQDCFSKLEKAGHQVEAVSLPLLDLAVPAYYVLTTAEASTNLSRYDGVRYGYRSNRPASSTESLYAYSRSEGFGGEVKRRILLGTFVLGAGYQEAYFTRAQQIRRMISDSIRELFNRCDALLLPTSPTTAFLIGEKPDNPTTRYLADIYTVPANLAGIPALSLPLFHHSDGMPFGLQVMTTAKDELTLLQAGKHIIELYRTAS